jgi:acetyl-CoA carboxylase carboxyltransferase component
MKFESKIREHAERAARARATGGAKKLAKRKQEGQLNVRERIDALLATRSKAEDRFPLRSFTLAWMTERLAGYAGQV